MPRERAERRKVKRHRYRSELHYRPSALSRGRTTNLTEMGIAFEAERALEPGTALELFLINRNIRLDGVVEYSKPLERGRYRIGVAFDKPEPELVDVLLAAQGSRSD